MQAEIRVYFEAEARELIDRLTQGPECLGADPAAAEEAVRAMLRAAHTLKGASHVVGEARMATLAHEFEEMLARYRKGEAPDAKTQLLALADELKRELAGSAPQEPSPHAALPVATNAAPVRMVRVDIAETGKLLEHAGQSGVLSGAIRATLDRLEALEGTGTSEIRRLQRVELRQQMRDGLDRLDLQMREMHRLTSQLRLASTETLLLEVGRMVRATAAQLGKEVNSVTQGTPERVDIKILEALGEALLHLVRNALAHGVESAAERIRLGKPPVATITVSVERDGTNLILRCADDGRGVPLARLRTAAISQGVIPGEEAAGASAAALLAILLRPGFSMGGKVDEISGRGVGLDAVREAAESVGGGVEVQSVEGQGATFTVTVPQRQFAVSVLTVSSGGRSFGIPLSAVQQTFRMESHHTAMVQGSASLLVNQETMPFLQLQDVFPAAPEASATWRESVNQTSVCLVIRVQDRRFALGVDRIQGLEEVLVHPIPTLAGAEAVVAGASIATDGTPQLVLNPGALRSMPIRAQVSPVEADTRSLPILIVDDSLTTRMLEESILEAEGYVVEVANSAEQGLAMARLKPYALFLVDVEMPGMNGYEFVAAVNAEEELRRTPSILVTSLDSAESREQGRAAGAFSYIVKGEFNQGIYLERIRSAVGRTASRREAR